MRWVDSAGSLRFYENSRANFPNNLGRLVKSERNSSGGELSFLFSVFVEACLLTALIANQFRAEPGIILLHLTILLRELVDEVSGSGFHLDLGIALSVVSAKVQPHELFSPAEDALKRRT